MNKIIVHHSAAKYLQRLPKNIQEHIKTTLKQLEINPLEHADVKAMAGEWTGYYRLRIGKFRIIFWYDKKESIVYIDHIGARGDVYK
jgi:mRNA interferase RelE/StbE